MLVIKIILIIFFFSQKQIPNKAVDNFQNGYGTNNIINNTFNNNNFLLNDFNMPPNIYDNKFPNNITNLDNISNVSLENIIQNINQNSKINFNDDNNIFNGNNEINNNKMNFFNDNVEQMLDNSNYNNLKLLSFSSNSPLPSPNDVNQNLQNFNSNPHLFYGKKKNYNNKKKNNNNNFNNSQLYYKENNKEKDIRDFKNFCEELNCSLPDYICSQIGSRIMQKYLNRFPPFIITNLIEKIYMYFEKMMCDIYGNYFCQKLYRISSIEQRRMILNSIKDIFITVSETSAGAHVTQSIIEESTTKEEKMIIISYVKGHEMEMALHPEGTHVLQKIIQIFPENERQNITDALCTTININILCQDLKGISVIKRLISFNTEKSNRIKLVESFLGNILEISKTSSGSYIIQYLLEQWGVDIGFKLIFFCVSNFESFAVNKHSSNLIDKILFICLKRYNMTRTFVNDQGTNFINNEIIIITALKNIILEPNKLINI